MRVAGYLRVSTEDQAESGLSLSNQREKINLLAQLQGWTLLDQVEDPGVSAGTMNRPGLQRLLGLVRTRAIKGIVVYKLDRLTRSQRHLLELLDQMKRYGVRLVSVCEQLDTSSASGRFFIQMLGSVAEWEKGVIGERTEAAINQIRKERRRFSRYAPLGWKYKPDGRMVEVPREQEAVKMIHALRGQGLSFQRICNELSDRGVAPRSGKGWSTSVIKRVVDSTC